MKNNLSLLYRHVSVVVLLGLVAGCASVAVTSDAIENNTASALGLEKGTFTISNREDDGIKSTYLVNTNAGKKYSCYVTGTVSVVGRVVSDAVCNEVGKSTKQSTGKTLGACNALLKAAGKCN
jgi:nitrate/nitrite transporter NarK